MPPQGPPPQGPPPGGPPGGFPPYGFQQPPEPAAKKQQDAEPGRFRWWDMALSAFYVVMFILGGMSLMAFIPPFAGMVTGGDEVQQQQGLFAVNAVGYVLFGVLTLTASAVALWRSVKRLKFLWWLKILLVPVAWIATLVLNIVVIFFIFGTVPETSENQAAIEGMLGAVPFLAALVVIGLLGPFVEEFFFRHLLIGKLSRYINVWICGLISVVTFPLLHFIPALMGLTDDLTAVSVVPYVTMGLIITVGYIISGRNLFYAWLLHAFNNVMSLTMAYFLEPAAEDSLDQLEQYGAVLRLLTFTG